MMNLKRITICALLLLINSAAFTQETVNRTPIEKTDGTDQRYWKAEVYNFHERGDYDTGDTIGVMTTGGRLAVGDEFGEVRLSLPFVYIYDRGPNGAGTPANPKKIYTKGYSSARNTDDDSFGIGDMLFEADIHLIRETPLSGGFLFDLKLPTADEDEGLGTGEVDWSLGFFGNYVIKDDLLIFGRYKYTIVGEPSRVDFDNISTLQVGPYYQATKAVSFSAYLEIRETIDSSDEAVTAFGSVRYKQAPYYFEVTPYLGLTKEAPDIGVGLTAGMRF